MPLGPYKDFAACIAAQIRKGHSRISARKICGEIEKRASGESMKNDWRVLNFLVPITSAFARDEDFYINGTAINSTVTRNGVKYVSEELERAAPTLRNKPILKDHKNSVDSIVGRTTEKVVFNTGKIEFEGRIMDKEIQQKIKDGRITSVSVGAMVNELSKETAENGSEVVVAKGIDFVELSLVAIPADPNAGFGEAVMESWKMKENIEEMLHCPECEAEFETKKELKKHMTDKHDKEMEEKSMEEMDMEQIEEMRKQIEEMKKQIEMKFKTQETAKPSVDVDEIVHKVTDSMAKQIEERFRVVEPVKDTPKVDMTKGEVGNTAVESEHDGLVVGYDQEGLSKGAVVTRPTYTKNYSRLSRNARYPWE